MLTGTGQPLDATLTALAALATGGESTALLSRAPDTLALTTLSAYMHVACSTAPHAPRREAPGPGHGGRDQLRAKARIRQRRTGFTGAVTATVRYVKVGRLVTLPVPTLTGTSNATTFTVTGLPVALRPAFDYTPGRLAHHGQWRDDLWLCVCCRRGWGVAPGARMRRGRALRRAARRRWRHPR